MVAHGTRKPETPNVTLSALPIRGSLARNTVLDAFSAECKDSEDSLVLSISRGMEEMDLLKVPDCRV